MLPDRPSRDDAADPEARLSPVRCSRRRLLSALAAAGVGTAVFQRALASQVEQQGAVTREMIQQAEWIAGIELNDEQRDAAARSMQKLQADFALLRAAPLGYEIPPALTFFPAGTSPTDGNAPLDRGAQPIEYAAAARPAADQDLAFLPVVELAALLRRREVSSEELTRLYLDRLQRYDPLLHCVVSLTDDVALQQARQADRELAAGHYRGPLHGIPWGAKDLIAYPGYKTTWGAKPFQEQCLDVKATVARRLEDAGAVLVAKLSLGALAWGDDWFGGVTRNPWNPEQGSSGSSAGSASAAAAGLVGFALGSETLGSIVSPCRRCGATGLRPTFGRVSRHGCMALAWTMDKIGPIARSVQDCALIFAAIHGGDGLDSMAQSRPFRWPSAGDIRKLRVGYFEDDASENYQQQMQVLRSLGVELRPVRLPDNLPVSAMTIILNVEAATVFDTLTRQNVTDGLNRWPGAFHQGEFTPAVEYLRANRLRTLLIREMEAVFENVDVYLGGNDLAITNLTGHPCVVLPTGFRERDGRTLPETVTFTGRLFGDEVLLALAHAFEQAGEARLRRPPLDQFLTELSAETEGP
jgi:Asp-tRNA(Asn)/Glu-tRNA(Gln) amidotransferase A subunit family amidase